MKVFYLSFIATFDFISQPIVLRIGLKVRDALCFFCDAVRFFHDATRHKRNATRHELYNVIG